MKKVLPLRERRASVTQRQLFPRDFGRRAAVRGQVQATIVRGPEAVGVRLVKGSRLHGRAAHFADARPGHSDCQQLEPDVWPVREKILDRVAGARRAGVTAFAPSTRELRSMPDTARASTQRGGEFLDHSTSHAHTST